MLPPPVPPERAGPSRPAQSGSQHYQSQGSGSSRWTDGSSFEERGHGVIEGSGDGGGTEYQAAFSTPSRGKGKERSRAEDGRVDLPLAWSEAITVHEGVFAGRIVRFCVRCVQDPVSGRRKTEKDRRPLAPVPIVRLWAKQCFRTRTSDEFVEEDLATGSIDASQLVCAAEISRKRDIDAGYDFSPDPPSEHMGTEGPPIEDPLYFNPSLHSMPSPGPGPGPGPPFTSRTTPRRPDPQYYSSFSAHNHDLLQPFHYADQELPAGASGSGSSNIQRRASWVADAHWDVQSAQVGSKSSAYAPPPGHAPVPVQESFRAIEPADRVKGKHRKGSSRFDATSSAGGLQAGSGSDDDEDEDPRGGKKLKLDPSRNLYGNLHVTGVKVPDPDGVIGIWFLFTDLCVRQEGIYTLRFSIYDLSVVKPDDPLPIPHLFQCESQPFKVYSPRTFPGLPKPTELSEHFVRQGFKLNTRKNERQAKSVSPPTSSPIATKSPFAPRSEQPYSSAGRRSPPLTAQEHPNQSPSNASPSGSAPPRRPSLPSGGSGGSLTSGVSTAFAQMAVRPGPQPVQESSSSASGSSGTGTGTNTSRTGTGTGTHRSQATMSSSTGTHATHSSEDQVMDSSGAPSFDSTSRVSSMDWVGPGAGPEGRRSSRQSEGDGRG